MKKLLQPRDIVEQLPNSSYRCDVDWSYIDSSIQRYLDEHALIMEPDFQRGHVWTQSQQIKFIEWGLRGGRSGMDIYFNHPNWMGSGQGNMLLVDGLQRITAVTSFMASEFPVFEKYYAPELSIFGNASFTFHVAALKTKADVLKWYLAINSGGVVHSEDELNRVRALLAKEEAT